MKLWKIIYDVSTFQQVSIFVYLKIKIYTWLENVWTRYKLF